MKASAAVGDTREKAAAAVGDARDKVRVTTALGWFVFLQLQGSLCPYSCRVIRVPTALGWFVALQLVVSIQL